VIKEIEMETKIHVKPEIDGGWGVYKFNRFQNFRDDLRFGLRVAIYNFLYLLHIPVKYIRWIA
jgi:hypothetical protein